MLSHAFPEGRCGIDREAIDRSALIDWYLRNRARSSALFELLSDDAYYSRPIALRHPIVFYEGHLPAFSFNTLVKRGLGGDSIDAALERLFARGIDPHDTDGAPDDPVAVARLWPSRDTVRQFAAEVDRRVLDALGSGDIEQPGHPLLDRAEAAYCILEHEAMHHETLLYMWHRLPFAHKRRPTGYLPITVGHVPESDFVTVPAGEAVLGVAATRERFTWDNERPALVATVPAFRIERHDVTNHAFMAFVAAEGYRDPQWWTPADWAWRAETALDHPTFWERDGDQWWWRGMFERVRLPGSWPVYVSQAEAAAFARWRGARLPTEAEYQRAAFGTPAGSPRRYPWGAELPAARHGVFDLARFDPSPVGTHPNGDSAWGIADLMGNGWEWTSSVFAPFPGFTPLPSYPEYSADFFDGEHYVLKGASPATATGLLRPTFRNWFRPRYPYVYATFRCVTGITS
ncbi:MAG: SUMF1/EgtB/PvdO family nonheme iron enzyme [Acidobacteriota bacterium]